MSRVLTHKRNTQAHTNNNTKYTSHHIPHTPQKQYTSNLILFPLTSSTVEDLTNALDDMDIPRDRARKYAHALVKNGVDCFEVC